MAMSGARASDAVREAFATRDFHSSDGMAVHGGLFKEVKALLHQTNPGEEARFSVDEICEQI